MNWLGDYPEDFTTVAIYFTTHDSNGAPVAPLTAFETADVSIYKNGSNAQKTTTNGVTMTSPFDSIVGLHCVVIDTSNDTGDAGFWTTGGGGVYSVLLNPDTETVNGQVALKVLGTFGIALSPALRPTVAGRTLDVSSTGEAGVDWANVGSPTTSLALTGTTIASTQKVDVDTIKTNPVVNGGTATFPTNATLASTTNITAGTMTTTTNVTNVSSGGITAASFASGALDAVWSTATRLLTAGTNIVLPSNGLSAISAWTVALTGNITGNLSGSIGSVASGGIAAASFAANALDAVWSTATRLLTAGTNIVLAKGTGVTGFNDLTAAQVNAEADTALADAGVTTTVMGRIDVASSTRLAASAYTAPDNATIALIDAKTTNLPSDPADQSLIVAATDSLATLIGDVPTNAELATALGAADDATLAAIAALNIPSAAANAAAVLAIAFENAETVQDFLRLSSAVIYRNATGLDTDSKTFRDEADSKDRVVGTQSGGDRSVVLDPS